MGKRKKKRCQEEKIEEHCIVENEKVEGYFEDAPPYDENSSFYQMNLSRPLMKVR